MNTSTRVCALISLLALGSGCSNIVDAVGDITGQPTSPAEALASGDERTVELDPAFTPSEQAEIGSCFNRWREFSGGEVNLVAVNHDGDLRFLRAVPPSNALSEVSFKQRTAWIDADRVEEKGRSVEEFCLSIVATAVAVPRHTSDGVLGQYIYPEFTEADKAAWNSR